MNKSTFSGLTTFARPLEEWRAFSPGERLLIRRMVEQAVPAEFPYTDAKNTTAPRLFIATETDRSSFLPGQAKNFAKKRADLGQPVQTHFRNAFFREEFSHPEKTRYFNSLLAFLSEQSAASSDK